jgi:hypothetical protein
MTATDAKNLVKVGVVGTPGTGTISLGAALSPFFGVAELTDAKVYGYTVIDGNKVATGFGTYTAAGATLTRDAAERGNVGGVPQSTPVSLSAQAIVLFSALAQDLLALAPKDSPVFTGNVTLTSGHIALAEGQYLGWGNTQIWGSDAGDYIGMDTAGVTRVYVGPTGLVGIGTATPDRKLTIGNGTTDGKVWIGPHVIGDGIEPSFKTSGTSGALVISNVTDGSNVALSEYEYGASLNWTQPNGSTPGALEFHSNYGTLAAPNYHAVVTFIGNTTLNQISLRNPGDTNGFNIEYYGPWSAYRISTDHPGIPVYFGPGADIYMQANAYKVGIGNEAPLSKLGITGNVSIGATYGVVAAPTSGMIIEGNVGIGTASPEARFVVSGGALAGAAAGHALSISAGLSAGRLITSTAADISAIHSYHDSDNLELSVGVSGAYSAGISISGRGTVSPTGEGVSIWTRTLQRLTVDGLGNVGIGTASPTSPLTVNGDAEFSGTVNIPTLRVTGLSDYLGAGANSAISFGGALKSIEFITNGSQAAFINSSGNVGIGMTPTATLSVNGPIGLKGYTVGTLPSSPVAGWTCYVTDATAPTYNGALTGGGAVVARVMYDGAAWKSV